MQIIKQLDRLNKIHQLIEKQSTGCPEDFANQLHICRRQLYNELEHLKILGAPIKYCKNRQSFYYATRFELELHYSLKIIVDDEIKKIFGGFYYSAMKLHGSQIHLLNTKEVLEKPILF